METNSALTLKTIAECGQYQKVLQAIESYLAGISLNGLNGICAPINVKFDFDYAALAKVANDFLELLLFEPVECLDELRAAVWCHINANLAQNGKYLEMSSGICGVKIQQIHCSIRFIGLPLTEEEFIFRPFVHPIRLGVTTMHCVLSGLGERGTYVQQSIWYCPLKCARNDCHIVGRCPFDWTRNYDAEKCSVCLNDLKENTDYRKVAEYRSIKVHLAENVQTPAHLERRIKRGVTVQLVDDSCDVELNLGDEYILVGNYNPMANQFNAWTISPCV